MAIIRELSPHIADLIAAGEVVERPASVAKELIENSIDAGATSIIVEIQNGGITYLRISDNGIGISPEDAPIAFRRHATSKIQKEEDLSHIGTLGFRGEALAAIASVSRITLFTKQTGALEGVHLELEASTIITNESTGCPEGTTFIIRDLFYNTPARMKFLKKDFTEANYILSVVQHVALSNPAVAFKCIKDGKTVFNTSGTGDLFSAIFNVFGKDLSSELIKIDSYEMNGYNVFGFVSKPHSARANRSMQHFFVNGRYVKSRLVQAALEEAYKNSIINGKYPYCCICLTMPYSMVDVNVHPAKIEVKFAYEKQVFDIVYAACKNTLVKNDNIPEFMHRNILKKHYVKEDNITANQQVISIKKDNNLQNDNGEANLLYLKKEINPINFSLSNENIKADLLGLNNSNINYDGVLKQNIAIKYSSSSEIKKDLQNDESKKLPEVNLEPEIHELIPKSTFKTKQTHIPDDLKLNSDNLIQNKVEITLMSTTKVVGQCFNTYIIAENKDGLVFIDKHAAHERIIFNKLRKTAEITTQVLLSPIVSDFSREETAAILEGLEPIRQIGFDIEAFGEQSFIVRQVPSYLDSADVAVTLTEIAQKLMDKRSPVPNKLDDLIHTVSCKAAIKAGSKTSDIEMQELCDRVLSDPEIASCPHGRPVTVKLTKYEMDKLFKRVNQ